MNTLSFRHLLLICNPTSTHTDRAIRHMESLREVFPDAEYHLIETKPEHKTSSTSLLRPCSNILGPDTLLCIAGGDGTVNLVLQDLLNNPTLPDQARKSPLLPLWGGNANDLACMLNGQPRSANIARVIATATIVEVFPLLCTLVGPKNDKATYQAACYASFGASATTAHTLSHIGQSPKALLRRPGWRFLHELSIVISTMSRAPTFAIETEGHVRTIYEYTFLNGTRLAKVSGIKQRLTDRTFYGVAVAEKKLPSLFAPMVALSRSKQAGQFKLTQSEFVVQRATWAQFDGETIYIDAGTSVTISVSSRPFYALSTLSA